MAAISPQKVPMRVYFDHDHDKYTPQPQPTTTPVSIMSHDRFDASVNTSHLAAGWYWTVFSAAIEGAAEGMLRKIIFDFTSTKIKKDVSEKYTWSTVVTGDEIANIPKAKFVRMRLHHQIKIIPESNLTMSIKIEAASEDAQDVAFELDYFELTCCYDLESEDHVLWGENNPDQMIRIKAEGVGSDGGPVAIEAYNFSDTGKLAVTMYFTDEVTSNIDAARIVRVAHIDVWDLSALSEHVSTDDPRPVTKSRAITYPFSPLKSSPVPKEPKVIVNISRTGAQIVMARECVKPSGYAAQFVIFRLAQQHPPIDDYKLVPKTCQSLQASFGYGAFHNTHQNDSYSDNECYFKFHGSTFIVYSTDGNWRQLYLLTLGIIGVPPGSDEMSHLCQTLRGHYFTWTGDKGQVSIWDFVKGRCITTIFISKGAKAVGAVLSEDGSLVAISLNGSIQVHDVVSGIKLGVHPAEQESNEIKRIIGQDYFMALNTPSLTILTKNKYALNVLRAQNTMMIQVHRVFREYGADFPVTWNPIFAHRQGATLNIKRLDNFLSSIEANDCVLHDACEHLLTSNIDFYYGRQGRRDVRNTKMPSDVGVNYVYSFRSDFRELKIINESETWTISLNTAANYYQGFFMAERYQMVLIMNGILQVWQLPSTTGQLHELVHVEAFVEVPEVHAHDGCIHEILSVQVCQHGRRFRIEFKPIKCIRGMNGEEVMDELDSKEAQFLTFPRTNEDTFSENEKYRYEKGITSLLDTYAGSDSVIKDAIIRFLVGRIRPSPKFSSSLAILCRSWKYEDRVIFEEVITNLLPDTSITWIPDIDAKKKDDALSILLFIAKANRSVLGACKIIMNYCEHHAIRTMNLSFLSPFLRNLRNIVVLFPDEARACLQRIAYFPVSDRVRDDIAENSTTLHSSWRCIQSRSTPLKLDTIKKPIMQLHLTAKGPRIKADTSNRPICVASFHALWHFKDKSIREWKNSGELAVKQVPMFQPWSPNMIYSTEATWWKSVFHIIRLKCQLKTHAYVTCHSFSLEFFDNPAIALLVAYKWNTIGYAYFAFRFFFQCVFYILVSVAALLQVYHENVERKQLGGVFISIIILGTVFLWLEFLQAIRNFKRYRRNRYNLLDIFAYALPVGASCSMLVILCNSNTVANTRVLSYSVLAVFLHMLFELRIYESVCKYGGRFDPVAVELNSEDWAFHFMMAIYFFFTVIVMLNVLIALINKAFTRGDDDWRLDCIEARMRCIELAENLSYHIPGFRQAHNWFPKEIYFYATLAEIEQYGGTVRASEDEGKASLSVIKDLRAQMQNLESRLESQRVSQQEQAERQFKELKDLLLSHAKAAEQKPESDQ
ncbi:hypothetical protein EC968_006819 [Mortierella alpina]|nr:hypothetical protein EC968_006819 [Mortierella alpina]